VTYTFAERSSLLTRHSREGGNPFPVAYEFGKPLLQPPLAFSKAPIFLAMDSRLRGNDDVGGCSGGGGVGLWKKMGKLKSSHPILVSSLTRKSETIILSTPWILSYF
jgi:hypothetical protein